MKTLLLVGLWGSAGMLAAGGGVDALPPGPKDISGAQILSHIKTLASDEFEGRSPGSRSEQLAVKYIVEQFKRGGLKPGNPDGTFIQDVPLIGSTSRVKATFEIKSVAFPVSAANDYVARSPRSQADIIGSKSTIVFAGYGIVAPEFDWDDFKNVDVAGRTVVLLDGEPTSSDDAFFRGETKTYYGTQASKLADAASRGAAAVFIVHDPAATVWSFANLQASFQKEAFELDSRKTGRSQPTVYGWLTLETWRRLCEAAHQNAAYLAANAESKTFSPISLSATARFVVHNNVRRIVSHNVVAQVTGADPARRGEVVIYTAPWVHQGRDVTLRGDQSHNGAIDNAAGVAQLLEIARAFAACPTPPRRSMLFIATAADGQSCLGARYYTEHPFFPLSRTLADINLDSSNLWGRTQDVINLGSGLTSLDEVLAEAAATQQRKFSPFTFDHGSDFFLSDPVEFAKAGIPSVFPSAGSKYRDKPAGYGDRKWTEYRAKYHHQVADEVQPDWDMSGAVEDAQWLWLTGFKVAQADSFPDWKKGSGFSRKP
ncbi:MAG: M28 family peptidase [Opitutaceae bacterium]